MKIAIGSAGKDLQAQIVPRFGRCRCFLLIETDDFSFEVFENDNAALGGGAGIQSAQFLLSHGAQAVITGNCGPNAMQVLSAAGIQVFVGQTGTVEKAVQRFNNGDLTPAAEASVPAHAGMGRMGMGRGRGGGGRSGPGFSRRT